MGTGSYGTKYKAFPVALQNRLTTIAQQGTDIMVTGAFVATDIWDNPLITKADAEMGKKFAAEVLGFKWRTGQASTTGEAYGVQSRFKEFGRNKYRFNNTLNALCYVVESPDSFYPADDKKGATIMRYSENNLVSGIASDNGTHQTVVIGFPFETITDEQQRNELMKSTLDFFKNRAHKPAEKKETKTSKKRK